MLRKRQNTPFSPHFLPTEPKVSKIYSMPQAESLAKKGLQKEKALKKIQENIKNKSGKTSKKSNSITENESLFEDSSHLINTNVDELSNENHELDVEIIDNDLELLDNSIDGLHEDSFAEPHFEDADFELLPQASIVNGEKVETIPLELDALLLDEDEDEHDLDELEDALFTGLIDENPSNLPEVARPRLPNVFVKDNLQLYLREISSFPMLTPEEEQEFAHKVRESNDPDAAFRLISSHLRLVVKVAMEFQKRWMQNVLDLIQEGNIGLVRAVNKFDPDKGIKFSYYAKFWIRAYILKFIMDNWRMVKIGTTQAQRKLFYNLNKEKQKLINQGFDPDMDVLVERLGVSKEDILEMEQRLESTDLSLDTPVGDENGSISRIEYLPALTQGIEEGFAENEITNIIHNKLEDFIPMLSDKELFILENRLLTDDPITLREIGEKYNVTRERIRQLEARLVEKMRVYLTSEIDDFSEDWI